MPEEISNTDRLFDAVCESLEAGMNSRQIRECVSEAISTWKIDHMDHLGANGSTDPTPTSEPKP